MSSSRRASWGNEEKEEERMENRVLNGEEIYCLLVNWLSLSLFNVVRERKAEREREGKRQIEKEREREREDESP